MTIEVRLNQVILRKQFEWGRNITYREISEQTGISESTIARLKMNESKRIALDVIDRLCTFFHVQPGDVLVYVPDSEQEEQPPGGP